MTTREEALAAANKAVQDAQDSRTQAIRYAEEQVRLAKQLLDTAKAMKSSVWPKRRSLLVGNYGDCGENLIDWGIEECGFAEDSPEMNVLSGILYESEAVFDIFEDGTYKLVGYWYRNPSQHGEMQGFGERGKYIK